MPEPLGPAPDVLRFGVFDLDPATGELRRSGMRVRLTPQGFRILLALLEAPGEPVSREQLRRALWGEGTFVDFDHSLNFAIGQLRRALGDQANRPRFIETLPTVGYRFVAPVEHLARTRAAPPAVVASRRGSSLRAARALAAGVVAALALHAASRTVPSRAAAPEPRPGVRDAYLRGLYHAARSTSEWPAAETWLRRAVAEDPGFAAAQGALAGVYVRLAEARLRPGREVLPLARTAAAAAVRTDGGVAEAHVWSGLAALYGAGGWDAALLEIRTALALAPDLASAHRAHAAWLSARGDHEAALDAIDRARRSDPLCPVLTGEAGWYRYCARRYDEAVALWEAAAAVRPTVEVHEALVHAHRMRHDEEAAAAEAVRAMRAAGVPEPTVARLARRPPAEVVRGYSRGAVAFLTRAGTGAAVERLAVLHATLGEHDQALSVLERAWQEHSPGLLRALRDPALEGLWSEARFRRLLERVQLSS